MKRLIKVENKKLQHKTKDSFIIVHGNSYFAQSHKPRSRYEGLFINDFKSVHNIGIKNHKPDVIETDFASTTRLTSQAKEIFYLANEGLLYEIENCEYELGLELDFRGQNEFELEGRVYNIKEEKEYILIEYIKYATKSLKKIEYKKYMAIKGIIDYTVENKWALQDFKHDKLRNSEPSKQWIFKILNFHVYGNTDIAISVADSPYEAIRNAKRLYDNRQFFKEAMIAYRNKLLRCVPDLKDSMEQTALDQNILLLNSLTVQNGIPKILAGMPWFNQDWKRDEAFSAYSHNIIGNKKIAKEILLKYTRGVGNLKTKNEVATKSVDARLIGFFNILRLLRNEPKLFSKQDLQQLYLNLKKNVENIMQNQLNRGLIENKSQETWMDSLDRKGRNIELQSLLLATYDLIYLLSEEVDHKHSKDYKKIITLTKKKIHKEFYRSGRLYDGVNNEELTSNVFLAYYYYPRLFSKKRWEKIFDNSLKELWLEWGGVSTISKHSEQFMKYHTGEIPESYHRGDSWFYVNNVAAISMLDLNSRKYKHYIKKIIHATSFACLFEGYAGAPELTSASSLHAEGGWVQAWTSASFIELMFKYYKI